MCAEATAAPAEEARPAVEAPVPGQADRAPRLAKSQAAPVSAPSTPARPATPPIETLTAPLDMPVGEQPQRRFPRYS